MRLDKEKSYLKREIKFFKKHPELISKFQVEKPDDEFKIDEKHCLEVLDRINRGDFAGIEPIGDIDEYIVELKNANRNIR